MYLEHENTNHSSGALCNVAGDKRPRKSHRAEWSVRSAPSTFIFAHSMITCHLSLYNGNAVVRLHGFSDALSMSYGFT